MEGRAGMPSAALIEERAGFGLEARQDFGGFQDPISA